MTRDEGNRRRWAFFSNLLRTHGFGEFDLQVALETSLGFAHGLFVTEAKVHLFEVALPLFQRQVRSRSPGEVGKPALPCACVGPGIRLVRVPL